MGGACGAAAGNTLTLVSYTSAQARQELLDAIAEAIDEIALTLAALGGAYDLLDETSADTLEEQLFQPAQRAYGRAKRTYSSFAERYALTVRAFEPATPGLPSQGFMGFLEAAGEAAEDADLTLSTLQDSLRPVEVGDAELRAGLSEVRTLLAQLPVRSQQMARTFGR